MTSTAFYHIYKRSLDDIIQNYVTQLKSGSFESYPDAQKLVGNINGLERAFQEFESLYDKYMDADEELTVILDET